MNALKKILVMLFVIALVLSMVPAAFAAEVTEESTYVLKRVNASGDSHGANIMYSSLYVPEFTYNGTPDFYQTNIYTMYDTRTDEIIPVYCTDVTTGAYAGTSYRRLNLEDSNFTGSSAGLIRAIAMNGFYLEPIAGESSDAHTARAKANAAALGAAAGIEGADLTVSEAISATQCAIWQAAHGSLINFTSFVRERPNSGTCTYQTLCFADKTNGHVTMDGSVFSADSITYVNERIRTVYNYLLSLDPVAAPSKSVSSASFTVLNSPVFTADENGSYTVTVTAKVSVQMSGSDSLTLKATLGTRTATTALRNGTQTPTLTITDVPAELYGQPVSLSISGYQTASGFFLFDALGDRSAAQSMVGVVNSQLPVYASVVAEDNRILSFVKTTNSGHPLEGIVFDIFPVATLEEYLDGKELPEPENYKYPSKPEYTVITDSNGKASLDFTQHGMADGVYLVVERQHPAIVAPIKPFYVIFPATNAEGTGYDYHITVRPKNQVKGGVSVKKDVIKLDNNEASVDADVPHTWIISASIPEDISMGKSYVITDTLDNRLDFVGNVKVVVETQEGEPVAELTKGTDYTLTVTDVDSTGESLPSDAFRLELTQDGMSATAMAVENGAFSNYSLRVYFDAKINSNAEVATDIPNKALLTYLNSVNFTFGAESDVPVVHTGGANLLKVDAADHTHVLSGAVFEVYRPATPGELLDEAVTKVTLKDYAAPMVKVSFFDNAAMEGEKVSSVTSDENGRLAVYGLYYGTYYLVETAAPAGYNRMSDPVELTIDPLSHTEEQVVILENMPGAVMPETGGMGTTVYTVSGILLMSLCAVLLLSKNRRATR